MFKLTILRGKNQEENLSGIYSFSEHVSTKINTFRIDKGGLGASPPEADFYFKNQTKWRLFLLFLLFGKAPYIPKIMSLLPSSPNIITSAPQLPENK